MLKTDKVTCFEGYRSKYLDKLAKSVETGCLWEVKMKMDECVGEGGFFFVISVIEVFKSLR